MPDPATNPPAGGEKPLRHPTEEETKVVLALLEKAQRKQPSDDWLDAPGRPKIHYTELTDFPDGSPLALEWKTYRRELPRLLAEGHEWEYVLIKGEEILGLFATDGEAYRQGRQRSPLEPFLLQRIREWEPLLRLPWCG